MNLFNDTESGATFSSCRKYRYALWRIWDKSKPVVMFIGLNPSKATEDKDDATIRRVKDFAFRFGYGGFYMMNLFAYVSTDPRQLLFKQHEKVGYYNNNHLKDVAAKCDKVVFVWGAFNVNGRDKEVIEMFPGAECLGRTKDGYPKHPCRLSKKTVLQYYDRQ